MERDMLINLSLLFFMLLFLIFYRMVKRPSKRAASYAELYEKVINSDEYKVKGQYEE